MSAKGLLDVVLPEYTGAEGAQGAVTDGGEPDGEGGEAGRTERNTAMRRSKALAIIVSSLGDKPLRAVVGVRRDPREMWRRLHVRYARPASSTKVSLYEILANKRLKRGGNMQNHIAEFEQLYDRIDSMGDAVVEVQRVATLLRSVGAEYESIVLALRTVPGNMSWDDLTARLLYEYERRESAKNEGGASLISSQRMKRGPKCFSCGKYGHIKTNCTEKSSRGSEDSDSDDDAKKKRLKKSYSTKASKKKKPDRKRDESRKGMRLLMAKDAKEQEDDQVLIDSGASSHKAKTRDIMTSVKKIPERKIVTANNEVLVCNQSGDVDVRMYDPEGDVITTARLRKVLYVPGLQANLLSCAALTKSRVKVTVTSDGCRLVDQDDGQLIGSGAKGADGLCVLMADVVHQARASVATESSVNLWRARLGHVSKATIRDMVRAKKAKGITLSESLTAMNAVMETKLARCFREEYRRQSRSGTSYIKTFVGRCYRVLADTSISSHLSTKIADQEYVGSPITKRGRQRCIQGVQDSI
jgi:gag-polypeptide of LTR copia-type